MSNVLVTNITLSSTPGSLDTRLKIYKIQNWLGNTGMTARAHKTRENTGEVEGSFEDSEMSAESVDGKR